MTAVLVSLLACLYPPAAPTTTAFQPLNPLVGSWKGTGNPEGSREERQKGFWTETIAWEWRFEKGDAWLAVKFDNGKHFTRGDLRYLPEMKQFQFTATTPDKREVVYVGTLSPGKLKEQILTLTRQDAKSSEESRLVLTLLHHNRFLYRMESRPAGSSTAFTKQFQVGATKEGEAFADVGTGPECIVSGGQAKIPVTFQGKTYYVCCTGCRDEFKANPEKYVKEYEAKQAKK